MPDPRPQSVSARRAVSIWTTVHPIFAIGQLVTFLVSVSLLVAYLRGGVPYHAVHVSVLVKIGLMVGAVVTGALWEHDVYGYWWFAPEFLAEDVLTLVVFITQLSYVAMVLLHPGNMGAILAMLGLAYVVYVVNVAQYIHKTQRAKLAARREAALPRAA